MKTISHILLCLLFTPLAQGASESTVKTDVSSNKTENESWYIFFDSGLLSESYSGEIADKREDVLAISDQNDELSQTGFELSLGFYFPVNNHKTMIGPYAALSVSSSDVENFANNRDYDVSVTKLDLSFSAQHYFGTNIGSGFFVRGDAGASYVKFEVKHNSFCFFSCDERATINFRDGSSWTFESYGESRSITTVSPIALLGLGYSWGLGTKLRMQALLSHSYRPSTIGDVSTTKIGLGMLF